MLGGWRGLRLSGGEFPAGAGTKFGVAFDRRLHGSGVADLHPNRVDLSAAAAYSTRGYKRLRGGLTWRDVAGSNVDIEGFSQYSDYPQEDFVGFGSDRAGDGAGVKYTGRRPDDPNDLYPHERRRELRAMRVFAAWLNHDDARANNSIDAYVEDEGRRYVRHYMQDFGSNLGSGSTSAQQPRGGYEYLLEPATVGKGLVGLGLYRRSWMGIRWPKDPTIGNIEAEVFDPATWKTEYPNPAFNQLDAADAFWAASIISRFSDETIRAVVDTGRLSHPSAAAYLTDVIVKRRDKTVRGHHGDQPRRSLRCAGRGCTRAQVRERCGSSECRRRWRCAIRGALGVVRQSNGANSAGRRADNGLRACSASCLTSASHRDGRWTTPSHRRA